MPVISDSSSGHWKAYPEYKDSGVEWLGEIPVGWRLLPIKRIVRTKITDGPHETPQLLDDGIPFVSAESIKNLKIDFSLKRGFISEELHSIFKRKVCPQRNDIFIVKSGATTGAIAKVEVDFEFSIWSPLALIRSNENIAIVNLLFLYLQSSEFQKQVELSWSYGTQQNIGMNVIERLICPLPPLPEQKAIAAFLDERTARIDAIIDKKERQIELLKEKRSALISHVVTKGLDPDAEMKDSDVEWLGEIPAGWDVSKIKYLGSIRYGLGEPPEYVDVGLPFIRATDIYRGKIDLDLVKKVNPNDVPWGRKPELKDKEILIVRSGAYTGDSAIVTGNIVGCIAGYDMVLSIFRADPQFIAWAFLSRYMLDGQVYIERIRAAQPHLNAEELGDFIVLAPPLPEQKAIAEFLDRETARIDGLVEKVEASVSMLKEYRAALISAAVTGKIDVRDDIRA